MTAEQNEYTFFTVSTFLLMFLVGITVGQVFVIPGIFLMMTMVYYWYGLLVHVFMLAVILESYFRIIPRFCLVVPLLFYGGYYAFYFQRMADISATETRLQKENALSHVDFDPTRQVLVLPDAASFVQAYRVPVAYEQTDGAMSYRLIDRADCTRLKEESRGNVQSADMLGANRRFLNVCLLNAPETTERDIVEVASADAVGLMKRNLSERMSGKIATSQKQSRNNYAGVRGRAGAEMSSQSTVPVFDPYSIVEGTTTVESGGKVLSVFKTAAVNRLPVFPMFTFGCGLSDSPSAWVCDFGFWRETEYLKTAPADWDVADINAIIGHLLGIPKYTTAELEDFKTDLSNRAFVDSQFKSKR